MLQEMLDGIGKDSPLIQRIGEIGAFLWNDEEGRDLLMKLIRDISMDDPLLKNLPMEAKLVLGGAIKTVKGTLDA